MVDGRGKGETGSAVEGEIKSVALEGSEKGPTLCPSTGSTWLGQGESIGALS
jgi:hypothetical protein